MSDFPDNLPLGKCDFILSPLSKKQQKLYRKLKPNLHTLPDFTVNDFYNPVYNNIMGQFYLSHVSSKKDSSFWEVFNGQEAFDRIRSVQFYSSNGSRFPSNEIVMLCANLQLKRLKEEHAPQASGASSCSVCTPVDATSTAAASSATEEFDVESMDLILKSAQHLLEEKSALTAEIKKVLEPNSSC